MKRYWVLAIACLLTLGGRDAMSQPPRDHDQGREHRDGPPPRRPPGPGPREGRGPWEPGKIMPPHVVEDLKLNDDQKKKLADLENEVKEKILQLLSDEQKKELEHFKPQGPPPDDHVAPPPRGDRHDRGPGDRGPRERGPGRAGPGGRGPGEIGPPPGDGAHDGPPPSRPRRGPPRGPDGPRGDDGPPPRDGFRPGPDDDFGPPPPPRRGRRPGPPADFRAEESPVDSDA